MLHIKHTFFPDISTPSTLFGSKGLALQQQAASSPRAVPVLHPLEQPRAPARCGTGSSQGWGLSRADKAEAAVPPLSRRWQPQLVPVHGPERQSRNLGQLPEGKASLPALSEPGDAVLEERDCEISCSSPALVSIPFPCPLLPESLIPPLLQLPHSPLRSL